jgi:hypothetical protein
MSKRVYDIVTWTSKYKNAVTCRYTDIAASGRKVTAEGVVNKFVKKGDNDTAEISPIFEKILDQWTIERIDDETQRHENDQELRLREEERQKKEQREYEQIRKVFETKIEIFNIPEIAESKNREAKATIRRSKSSTEAIMNAIILMTEERQNAQADSESS